jgi:BirA family biotin operon repressor/biotin-[acetyl-CoA-carboxylase] ligase
VTEAFDVPDFLARLRSRGSSIGEPFTYFSSTSSTNELAKDAARTGATQGATFLADAQTAGRGRHGRQWLAEQGQSLLFSFILRPQLDPARLSALTLAVGLGVRAALAKFSPVALQVKWPNDVLASGKKLAGILVEAETPFAGRPSVIVGVGINVLALQAPEDVPHATSLAMLGATSRREEVLVEVLVAVEHWLQQLVTGRSASIVQELREHDALRDRVITVDGLSGVARGIDAQGCLLVESDGVLRAVRAGTVEWDGRG